MRSGLVVNFGDLLNNRIGKDITNVSYDYGMMGFNFIEDMPMGYSPYRFQLAKREFSPKNEKSVTNVYISIFS